MIVTQNIGPEGLPEPSGLSTTAPSNIVRHPVWNVIYQGQNITARITKMVVRIEYKDTKGAHKKHKGRSKESGAETDELIIELEDRDRRWQGPWFPTRGDLVTASMGYEFEQQMNCGNFQVDELELKGPPDVMHLKCIATGITPSLRSPRSARYENQKLSDVAKTVAARNGLTVVDAPQDTNISWNRISQRHETDLNFLRRLALDHGYDFTVRGSQLVFYPRVAVEQRDSVLVVDRTQTTAFSFKTKTQALYKSASVAYQDPTTKALIAATAQDSDNPTGDDLHIVTRSENPQQAQLKADSALHDANMLETTGELTTEGQIYLRAGLNITITGFKSFDGKYHIESSHHKMDFDTGYKTEIEVRKL